MFNLNLTFFRFNLRQRSFDRKDPVFREGRFQIFQFQIGRKSVSLAKLVQRVAVIVLNEDEEGERRGERVCRSTYFLLLLGRDDQTAVLRLDFHFFRLESTHIERQLKFARSIRFGDDHVAH